MPFKKTIFFLLLAGVAAGGWFYVAPSMAKGKIESYLTAAGYRPTAMGNVIIRPPYIFASNIQIDRDGFNTIGLLRAKVSDMSLTPTEVHIDDVRTAVTVESMASVFRLIGTFQKSLPPGAITIEKMVSDFATPYGDLRLESSLTIDAPDKTGIRAVSALVRARQYQLSFDTRWSGTIGADGATSLDAQILDGRFNMGPARLSRLSGWFAWNAPSSGNATLSGQIDAGSGTLFDLPLQDIALTIGGTTQETDIMFRTGLSGTDAMRLSMDTKITQTGTSYDAVLDIKDTDMFFSHVQTLQTKEIPSDLRFIGPVRAYFDYREDRRFTGGPLPFELRAISHDKQIAQGNILIYPETMELRGSAEMSESLARAMQAYFGIADDKRTGGALRLDGDIRHLMQSGPAVDENPSGVGAGIENNLGE